MGDQQQLSHSIPFNVQPNPRPADHILAGSYYACMRPSATFGPNCHRTPNQTTFQGTFSFAPTEFVADTISMPPAPAMPLLDYYMPGGMPMVLRPTVTPFFYGYPNAPEPSLPTPLQAVPQHMPSQHPSHLSYQMAPQPGHPQSVPHVRSALVPETRTLERKKKVLQVLNPNTHAVVDLAEVSRGTEVSDAVPPPTPVAPGESPPTKNTGDYTFERPPPVHKPLIPLEELQDKVAKVELVPEEEVLPEDVNMADDIQDDQNDMEAPIPNADVVTTDSKVARLLGETTDVESSAVSDEGEDDDVGRRIYNREFLLKCKDSPITQCPPEDFQVNRNMNRPGQRVIRLNTTIIVKRVEGAFVPSRLKKKDTDGGADRRQLSTELNVILNRLSEANLHETVKEIRKLNFSSPEDLQLLAKLVFQKVLIAELNAIIDSKIEAAKDESIKKILREDRETNILKKTEAYYGNITFLAELYLCRLFSAKSILQCLRKLKDSTAPESLTSLITLVQTCGPELEQQAKSQLDECFAKLNTYAKSEKVPAHQQYKIQELCERRARGWKKDPAQTAAPAEMPSRRPNDEKPRYSQIQPPVETKRKLPQSVNQLMPSSLAVTRQPCEARKLGPAVGNWSQGSGQLKTPADDTSNQSGKGVLLSATNRSREASPRVHAPHNVWTHRQSVNAKIREEYSTVLERNRNKARKIIDVLRFGDEEGSFVQDLPEQDRCAVLHSVIELSMDRDEKLRDAVGKFLAELIGNQIAPSDLESGCKMFFEKCDDDFLEDYPKGWEYIAQILQHLIQPDGAYFPTLLSILRHLHTNGRGATVLAHCFRLSAKRLGEEPVVSRWLAHRLDWKELGVLGDISDFVEKHMVQFTVSPVSCGPLKQLADLCQSSSTSIEQITAFFKRFSSVPPNFVRSCVQTMITNSTGLQRSSIDQRVLGLSILVDHKPDREAEVVQALTECSHPSVDQWRKSLLDKKVISSEALRTSNDSITKTLLHNV
ncbi:Translation initiation factor 4G [Fasciola hepatica]|uniref:Translation initiation factor 4G n=1 Tax=Fasciola hepatica TaxID=6192 RepID=A0A4E0R1D5_FASHE|nr:Translation initiation factor 4G [Fasciola hepatica]